MKDRYRLFLRRKSVYYAFDNTTKTFQSLKTKDKAEAARLLVALNEAGKQPAMNLGLARVYLKHSDPMVSERTWQHVFEEIIKLKSGPTQCRWQSAAKDKAFARRQCVQQPGVSQSAGGAHRLAEAGVAGWRLGHCRRAVLHDVSERRSRGGRL